MRHLDRACRSGLVPLLCALLALGCAYANRGSDRDRTPVIDTGAGARILYPGQSAVMPGQAAPSTAPQPAGSPDPAPGVEGAIAPGTTGVTFIGGANQDDKRSVRIKESPIYYKYLLLPFAVAAAPFVALADALRGEEEPGPEIPQPAHAKPAPPPPPQPVDYESQRLEAMERELDRRAATPTSGGAPLEPSAASGSELIAEELAALQRRPVSATPAEPTPSARPAETRTTPPPDPALVAADGIVDRDGDGRIDQWIFREDGQIVRNLFDEDRDGRVDRTLHYDRETRRIAQVEEDTNRDGAVDTWTDYREGQMVRRRADADQDGSVDSWSYYRNDQIARHESDTTGDGFRDRVRFYQGGALAREEQDNDGDGVVEVVLHYDAEARVVRRDEDTDADGVIDVISHYEEGRLARRELIGGQTAPTEAR